MLYLIDKAHGWTSFDLVKKVRNLTGARKAGHAGTLDPFATGLMLIATDDDTKQLHHLTGLDKVYRATIDLSLLSDTRDLEYRDHLHYGHMTRQGGVWGVSRDGSFVAAPDLDSIEQTLQTLEGTSTLPLTPFSAKKRKGKKLYHYARAGRPIMIPQDMTIHQIHVLSYDFPSVEIEVSVGSGTYIRSIAYRLGQQYGLGGTLTSLRRLQVGEYHLDASLDIASLEARL